MTIELIKTTDRYRDFSDISRIRDVIPVTASSTSTEREIIFERKSLVGWLICNPASLPSSSRCYKFLTSTRSRHQNSHHVRLSRWLSIRVKTCVSNMCWIFFSPYPYLILKLSLSMSVRGYLRGGKKKKLIFPSSNHGIENWAGNSHNRKKISSPILELEVKFLCLFWYSALLVSFSIWVYSPFYFRVHLYQLHFTHLIFFFG